MINHLYTHLMNRPAADVPEIVDPRFSPVAYNLVQGFIAAQAAPAGATLSALSAHCASLERIVWGSDMAADLELIDRRSTIRGASPGIQPATGIDIQSCLAGLKRDLRIMPIFDQVGFGLDGDYLRETFESSESVATALPAILVAFAASFPSQT